MDKTAVTLSEWISENLKRSGLSQKKLAELTGISEAAVSQYKNGKVRFCDEDILKKLSDAFGVRIPLLSSRPAAVQSDMDIRNIVPARDLVMIPIFDSASAGFGAYADECVVGYRPAQVPNPLEKDNYFFVSVSGVSMQPLIPDGSMVLVHKQSFIDDNSVAIVLLDGCEALVKRVRYRSGHVELISENPDFVPRIFENDDIERLRILGKVVECVMTIS